jgi:hypothetical protein
MSYTEMEYRYALERGKPIIAFLHKDPGLLLANRTENNESGRDKLQKFRELTERKMVKYWTTPSDLGSTISRSLIKLIKAHPAVGWVRGDNIPSETASQEILKLRKQIDSLQDKIRAISVNAPEGIEKFSQGDDNFVIHYQYEIEKSQDKYDIYGEKSKYKDDIISMTWNEIFSVISPLMIDEVGDADLRKMINNIIRQKHFKRYKDSRSDIEVKVNRHDYETIIIQLRTLGLIQQSSKKKKVSAWEKTFWTLTPYGDSIMTKLRAIKKPNF